MVGAGYCGDCGADEAASPLDRGRHADARLDVNHDYRPGYTVEDQERRERFRRHAGHAGEAEYGVLEHEQHEGEEDWYASAGCTRCYHEGRQADAVAVEAATSGQAPDPYGRTGLHGPDGWCGETRQHVHGLHEGIIEYTDGRDAAGKEIE